MVFREKGILETDHEMLKRQLRRLKSRYLITYFWAWHQNEVESIPFVDAHFAHPHTVNRFNSKQYRIKMHDMQFVPDYFEDVDMPKRWDLLCIATPTKHKNISKLLNTLKRTIEVEKNFTALLLFPRPKELENDRWDTKAFDIFYNDFTSDQKENIDMYTPIRTEVDIQPIPKDFLPYLYNSSKAFTLFSENEGGPKVIAEALMCGTPIVVPSSFTGGVSAYLDESNSHNFSNISEAKDIFIEIKNNHSKYTYDTQYLADELAASNSVKRLENRFKEIYKDLGIPYRGTIEQRGLDTKLAHHEPTVPRKYRKHPARGELKSKAAAYDYIKYHIFDDRPNHMSNIRATLELKWPDMILSSISSNIRYIDNKSSFPIYKHSKKIYNLMSN